MQYNVYIYIYINVQTCTTMTYLHIALYKDIAIYNRGPDGNSILSGHIDGSIYRFHFETETVGGHGDGGAVVAKAESPVGNGTPKHCKSWDCKGINHLSPCSVLETFSCIHAFIPEIR